MKEKDDAGYYWDYGASYSTLSGYYDECVFDSDKNLFVYHQKVWNMFAIIYEHLAECFEKYDMKRFSEELISYQGRLTEIFLLFQDFGHSRSKEFDDFLENYTNAVVPMDNLHYLLKNPEFKERAQRYQVGREIEKAKKYVDIVGKGASKWREVIGVTDEDYASIDFRHRKKPEFKYTQTLPVSENALDVSFEHKVILHDDKTFNIEGETNLFPGANLMLSVKNEMQLLCQGKATVSNGRYVFSTFSDHGKGFSPGTYSAEISVSVPETRPKEFTEAAGIEYENLTGKYINRTGIGPTIGYIFEFNI